MNPLVDQTVDTRPRKVLPATRTTDALWREHGEVNVPRDGNAAQAERESVARETAAPPAPLTARQIAYRCGVPESFEPFIARVIGLENMVYGLTAAVADLLLRVAALEEKKH